MKKKLLWALAVIALVAAIPILYFGFVLLNARRGLPQLSGEFQVAGLDEAIEIVRDENGVPHVFAQTERDTFFAQGFLHAQDRLWQMAIARRAAAGRMAEWFGPAAVRADKVSRYNDRLGAARRHWRDFPAAERFAIEAYAAGVNAYLRSDLYRRPPELRILHVDPEPWRPEDCFLVYQTLYGTLQVYGAEPRQRRLSNLAAAHAPELLNSFSDDVPTIIEHDADISAPESPEKDRAYSDNWTVSGEHTKSGKPLMANDPQLPSTTPSFWYLIHLAIEGRDVIGGSHPGLPSVLVGRNDSLVWGVTNAPIDTFDIALLEVDPSNPLRYRRGPGHPWRDFNVRSERIGVRFGDPIEQRVRHTERGFAVEEEFLTTRFTTKGENTISEWQRVGLEEETSLAGLLRLNRSESVEEAVVAIAAFTGPTVNFSLADTSGDIGYVLAGRIPLRPVEHATTIDFAPRDGNDEWRMLPYEENPRVINPRSGRIVTANQRIVGDSFPHYLTDSWASPWRAKRIHELLDRTDEHTIESFLAMQGDTTSLPALALLPHLLGAKPAGAEDERLLTILADWNGSFELDQTEPTIFLTWTSILHRLIAADELAEQYGAPGALTSLLHRVLSGELEHWCDNTTTPRTETCASLLTASLAQTRATLEAAHGADPSTWSWRRAAPMRHPHAFDSLPLSGLGSMFSRVRGYPGGPETLFINGVAASESGTFTRSRYSSSYQAIYDLADFDSSLFMISGGQSGHFRSKWYDNLLEPWSRGERIRILTDREEIDANAVLALQPRDARHIAAKQHRQE